jgi:hypothetical protein
VQTTSTSVAVHPPQATGQPEGTLHRTKQPPFMFRRPLGQKLRHGSVSEMHPLPMQKYWPVPQQTPPLQVAPETQTLPLEIQTSVAVSQQALFPQNEPPQQGRLTCPQGTHAPETQTVDRAEQSTPLARQEPLRQQP